ncbi:MAG: efflux transporter periplasmic adaptor subunit [Variovorax paradoxus]|uniref:Efflux transporter periplasmic adaptor subunit n=1 Tax=Variovorax paradoxus TaxID=34073 RepID=A0A2W5QME5_VARPD|nr:MAG: efflux transporter periplasmic adaptor subunit [Variovorax paradoxus]
MSSTNQPKPRRGQMLVIALLVAIGVVGGVVIMTKSDGKKSGSATSQAESGKKGEDGHGHGTEGDTGHAEEPVAKGPNGGDIFKDGDFSVELLLSEEGGEPRFKAWTYEKDKPAVPAGAKMTVSLSRPNGDKKTLNFTQSNGVWSSADAVAEPHIFEATVEVQTSNNAYLFAFNKDEGKVTMTDAQVKSAGITLEASSAASIRSGLQFPGEIRFNEDRTAHIVPRVQGVVDSVSANLGQLVKQGQVLAVISSTVVSAGRAELQSAVERRQLARTTYEREKKLFEERISPEQDVLAAQQALREAEIAAANANQKLLALGATPNSGSLGRFELRAPFDGIVVEKHIALGESVREDAQVFTISDLSSVWAEMSVPARDLPRVRVGEKVLVRSGAFDATANGTVAYVGSLIGEQTRTARARVTLPNPQGAWRPGLFVNVEVVAEEATVPVSVASTAIQTLEDKPVVFLKVPGGFVPQPVQLGRTDGKRVEIIEGLKAGSSYAAAGSFVVKSEQGKGSATHGH